jgi:hypothetical protein
LSEEIEKITKEIEEGLSELDEIRTKRTAVEGKLRIMKPTVGDGNTSRLRNFH